MTDIILNGCCGKMGAAVTACVASRNDCRIIAGVDIHNTGDRDYPVYGSIDDVPDADVIIDFFASFLPAWTAEIRGFKVNSDSCCDHGTYRRR